MNLFPDANCMIALTLLHRFGALRKLMLLCVLRLGTWQHATEICPCTNSRHGNLGCTAQRTQLTETLTRFTILVITTPPVK
jgi:hypothetical protein